MDAGLVNRFRAARRDPDLVVIEGFHALKHALRFNAEIVEGVTGDLQELVALARSLAPDVSEAMARVTRPVAPEMIASLAPRAPQTEAVAIARRPEHDLDSVLARPAPIILLENPRHHGNLGACVRVAAAADAAAVFCTGRNDPWHPDAVRAAAGLHFALPVRHVSRLPVCDRPLLAVDPCGEPLQPALLPPRAMLAFGSERSGLSDELLHAAGRRVRIPMRPGVSSLNLATAVAAVLFAWRLR